MGKNHLRSCHCDKRCEKIAASYLTIQADRCGYLYGQEAVRFGNICLAICKEDVGLVMVNCLIARKIAEMQLAGIGEGVEYLIERYRTPAKDDVGEGIVSDCTNHLDSEKGVAFALGLANLQLKRILAGRPELRKMVWRFDVAVYEAIRLDAEHMLKEDLQSRTWWDKVSSRLVLEGMKCLFAGNCGRLGGGLELLLSRTHLLIGFVSLVPAMVAGTMSTFKPPAVLASYRFHLPIMLFLLPPSPISSRDHFQWYYLETWIVIIAGELFEVSEVAHFLAHLILAAIDMNSIIPSTDINGRSVPILRGFSFLLVVDHVITEGSAGTMCGIRGVLKGVISVYFLGIHFLLFFLILGPAVASYTKTKIIRSEATIAEDNCGEWTNGERMPADKRQTPINFQVLSLVTWSLGVHAAIFYYAPGTVSTASEGTPVTLSFNNDDAAYGFLFWSFAWSILILLRLCHSVCTRSQRDSNQKHYVGVSRSSKRDGMYTWFHQSSKLKDRIIAAQILTRCALETFLFLVIAFLSYESSRARQNVAFAQLLEYKAVRQRYEIDANLPSFATTPFDNTLLQKAIFDGSRIFMLSKGYSYDGLLYRSPYNGSVASRSSSLRYSPIYTSNGVYSAWCFYGEGHLTSCGPLWGSHVRHVFDLCVTSAMLVMIARLIDVCRMSLIFIADAREIRDHPEQKLMNVQEDCTESDATRAFFGERLSKSSIVEVGDAMKKFDACFSKFHVSGDYYWEYMTFTLGRLFDSVHGVNVTILRCCEANCDKGAANIWNASIHSKSVAALKEYLEKVERIERIYHFDHCLQEVLTVSEGNLAHNESLETSLVSSARKVLVVAIPADRDPRGSAKVFLAGPW